MTNTNHGDHKVISKSHQEQLLKLVAKGFYNEMIKYGIDKREVITVAGHLLDNLMEKASPTGKDNDYYSRLFTLKDIQDQWPSHRRLRIGDVSLLPLESGLMARVAAWLSIPGVRDHFVCAFPDQEASLPSYFADPRRAYFGIHYQDAAVGIIGAENIDLESHKLEMRKLVGETTLHGKGIGKRATFLFLYYAFMILGTNKVYIHSGDINIRNLNLNNRFGFELEGVFFEEYFFRGQKQDVVRMGLLRSRWLEIFAKAYGS